MTLRTIIPILFFLLITLTITGCNDNDQASSELEQTVTAFWSDFQSIELEQATAYVSEDLEEEVLSHKLEEISGHKNRLVRKAVLESFQLEITGHDLEDGTATVYAELTHPHFDTFYDDERLNNLLFGSEYEDADDVEITAVLNEILADIPEDQTEDFNFELEQEGEEWVITRLPMIEYF